MTMNFFAAIARSPWPISVATAPTAETGPLVLAAVLLSLIVVYLASKIGGELCLRLDLPPVLGELLGGVVVGVSALDLLTFPEGGATAADSLLMRTLAVTAGAPSELLPQIFAASSETVSILAELGVILLLFEIGLESDLNELLRVGPQAAIVAIVGVVTPFVLGTGGLMLIFGTPAIPAIFAGAALTATSIGITAKVLAELQKLTAREGQIIIGAAVLDDILGIVILAVVASLAKDGAVDPVRVAVLIGSAGAFLIGTVVLGRLLVPYFIALTNEMRTRGQLLVMSLTLAFGLAYVASAIQLEGILGAFAAGLVLAETEKRHAIAKQVVPVADVLVPVFFVSVGAKTDLSVLNPFVPEHRLGLMIAVFLVAIAIAGKVVTGFALWGQKEGMPALNRLAIGVGMIPRGEVGLVFAGVGSASGVLSESLDAAIIVMVIATTFLAPPLLRVAFRQPSEISSAEMGDP